MNCGTNKKGQPLPKEGLASWLTVERGKAGVLLPVVPRVRAVICG